MHTALISCHHLIRAFADFSDLYASSGVEPRVPQIVGQQYDAAQMRELIVGMDCVIAGDDEVDASVLEAGKASRLKAVIKWGIGTDSIDKETAKKLGIPVFNTPGVFAEEVADLAMSHLLMLARGTHLMHDSIKAGGWQGYQGRSLCGLTAGVIGLGSIGQATARRAHAFGMNVIGSDVVEMPGDVLAAAHVRQETLQTVLENSDIVMLACNLTDENRHMLNAGTLASMKRGVWIINVARGPLIEDAALAAALQSGQVGAAGLDVFEHEPLPADSPLRDCDRCVFSTHNGSNTKEAVTRINHRTTDIAFDVLGVKAAQGFTPNRVA